tara:strand:- start:795 stop:1277 length:483 start_codon:yes stop_codon:yes gene_type:complete
LLPIDFTFLTEREFRKKYRFSKTTFGYIDLVLQPIISSEQRRVSEWGGRRHGVPSSLIIANSIRMLAGGSYHDIATASGIHPSTIFKHLWKFIDALMKADLGETVFYYEDVEWLESQARTFAGISPLGKKCVGALDGLAVRVKKPGREDGPRNYRQSLVV